MKKQQLTFSGTEDKQKNFTTLGYYISFIALGLAGASLGPTLPKLAENTQASFSKISYLFIARSFGYFVGSFLARSLYDRVVGHKLMVLSLVAMAVSLAFVPIIPLLWLLIAMLWLLGVFEALLDVGGNTLLVWVHGSNVGPFMNALHFFFGVGAFLTPIIVAQAVLLSGNINLAYWVLAVFMLLPAIFLARLPSPTNQPDKQDAKEGDGSQSNRILVGLLSFFFFLYVGIEIGFSGWLYSFALVTELANESVAAYLTSAFWISFTLGRLSGIPVAARLRPRAILLFDLLGGILSLGLLLIFPGITWILWVGVIMLGFSLASVFPTIISLAERRMTITGKVTGTFFLGVSLGSMSLPWLIGQFFETIGPQFMVHVFFVASILALGVYWVIMRYSEASLQPE